MATIRSFRDLKVDQNARVEAQRVFKLSQSFPREERFSLNTIEKADNFCGNAK